MGRPLTAEGFECNARDLMLLLQLQACLGRRGNCDLETEFL